MANTKRNGVEGNTCQAGCNVHFLSCLSVVTVLNCSRQILEAKLKGFLSACNIDELKSALSENNTAAIKKAAHAIRKASEKVGITSLAKAASRVEEAEDAKIASACQTLIEKYSEVIAFIAENEA